MTLLLKATIVALAGLAAARLANGSRASVRHVVLAATLAILLVLPVASWLAPSIRVVVPVPTGLAVTAPAATGPTAAGGLAGAAAIAPDPVAAPRASAVAISWRPLLMGAWIAGALIALLRIAAGLWQTRALRRSGQPWPRGQRITDDVRAEDGVRRRVDVLLHAATRGPFTYGCRRPAIVLPADAESWPDEDLRRAVVHELEHVGRGDWLTQSLGHAIAAAYWFHPLVWMVRRRFSLEAERACDDAVLRRAEATAYASQLVMLAQRMVEGDRPMLAMASPGDLSARVTALLNGGQRRGPAGSVWVWATGAAAIAFVLSLAPLRIVAAQSATVGQTYDVASIKPCDNEPALAGQRRQEFVISPGRVIIQCRPLARIIFFAYAGVGNLDNPLLNANPQDEGILRGGPDWMRTDLYTIAATAEGTSDRATLMGPMLRALLEDRFQLRTHRDGEEAPMYALVAAPGGLKIRPITPDGCTPVSADLTVDQILALDRSDRPICGNYTSLGDGVNRTWLLGGTTLERFAANQLSTVLDRHVIDRTGTTALFNIRLVFLMDDSIRRGVFGGRGAGTAEPRPDVEPAPTIFTALEDQLGLKLERTTGAREFLVIDRIERPTPN